MAVRLVMKTPNQKINSTKSDKQKRLRRTCLRTMLSRGECLNRMAAGPYSLAPTRPPGAPFEPPTSYSLAPMPAGHLMRSSRPFAHAYPAGHPATNLRSPFRSRPPAEPLLRPANVLFACANASNPAANCPLIPKMLAYSGSPAAGIRKIETQYKSKVAKIQFFRA